MRKLKNYSDFLKETEKIANKQVKVIESELSEEYSKNFWNLALKSKVFDDVEKTMIRENLINVEINLSLINEKNFLQKIGSTLYDAGAYVYGLGKQAWNWFCEKIESIRKGISEFIKGVKSFFMKLFYGAIDKLWKIAEKSANDSKIDELMDKAEKEDPEKLESELSIISGMVDWWRSSKMSEKDLEKLNDKLNKGCNEAEQNVESVLNQAQKELEEDGKEFSDSEEPSKNTSNEDILYTFYSYQKINEGEQKKQSFLTKFLNFISDLFGGGKFPENDKEGKPVTNKNKFWWFFKLIFRIFIQIFSPVTLLIKAIIKTAGKFILNIFSFLSVYFGYKPKPVTEVGEKVNDNFNYTKFRKVNEGGEAFESVEWFGVKFPNLEILSGITAAVFGLLADGASIGGYFSKIGHEKPEGWFNFMTNPESEVFGLSIAGVKDAAAKVFTKLWTDACSWALENIPVVAEIGYIFKLFITVFSASLMLRTFFSKMKKLGKFATKQLKKVFTTPENKKIEEIDKNIAELQKKIKEEFKGDTNNLDAKKLIAEIEKLSQEKKKMERTKDEGAMKYTGPHGAFGPKFKNVSK
jgi:hypothetical protein